MGHKFVRSQCDCQAEAVRRSIAIMSHAVGVYYSHSCAFLVYICARGDFPLKSNRTIPTSSDENVSGPFQMTASAECVRCKKYKR